MQKRVEFFRSIPIFKHWTISQIRKLVKQFNLQYFKRNQVFCTQGDNPDMIAIVNNGEFEAVRKRRNKT